MSAAIGLAEKVERIHRALDRAKIPHAFGGAIALAYYAAPRTTVDVDVNIFTPPDRYPEIVKILRRIGIEDLPDPDDVTRDGQGRALWGLNPIDLFFSYNPIHGAMAGSARTVPFGRTTIPIISPEHLLVAKVVFDRTKDWVDIEQMLIAVDDLDQPEIERWLDHLLGAEDARAQHVRSLWAELR
ncbi:MAG: nucleotidyl transferase AbiEii/AbiGii toxin family protein [Actinomycetota bacterium]